MKLYKKLSDFHIILSSLVVLIFAILTIFQILYYMSNIDDILIIIITKLVIIQSFVFSLLILKKIKHQKNKTILTIVLSICFILVIINNLIEIDSFLSLLCFVYSFFISHFVNYYLAKREFQILKSQKKKNILIFLWFVIIYLIYIITSLFTYGKTLFHEGSLSDYLNYFYYNYFFEVIVISAILTLILIQYLLPKIKIRLNRNVRRKNLVKSNNFILNFNKENMSMGVLLGTILYHIYISFVFKIYSSGEILFNFSDLFSRQFYFICFISIGIFIMNLPKLISIYKVA